MCFFRAGVNFDVFDRWKLIFLKKSIEFSPKQFFLINFHRSQHQNFFSYQPSCKKMPKFMKYWRKIDKKLYHLRRIVTPALTTQKYVFFITGLSKIIGARNKKLQNSINFHLNIHFMTIKSTTYAIFRKNSKKDQNWTPRSTGLR